MSNLSSRMYLKIGYISPFLLIDLLSPALDMQDLKKCVQDTKKLNIKKNSMFSFFQTYHLKNIENHWTQSTEKIYEFDKWFTEEWGIPANSAYIISKFACRRWKKDNNSNFKFRNLLKKYNNVSLFSSYLERTKVLHIVDYLSGCIDMEKEQAKWIIEICRTR